MDRIIYINIYLEIASVREKTPAAAAAATHFAATDGARAIKKVHREINTVWIYRPPRGPLWNVDDRP